MTFEPRTDNTATRLNELLGRGLKLAHGMNVGEAWRRLLTEPKSESQAVFLRRYARLLTTPQRLEREISDALAHTGDADELPTYLRWKAPLEKALEVPSSARWEQFLAHINDAVTLSLEHCALKLRKVAPRRKPFADQLAQVLLDVDAAWSEVESAKLPPLVAQSLRRDFDRLREAIEDASLFGADGVGIEVGSVLGAVIFADQDRLDKSGHSALVRAARHLWNIRAAVGFAVDAGSLVEWTVRLIESSQP